MKEDLYYISPRIVATDKVQEIMVRGKFPHSDLRNFKGEIVVDSVRADGLFTNEELPGYTCGNQFDMGRPPFEEINNAVIDENGILRFTYPFAGEGENTFRVRMGERVLVEFRVYSMPEKYLSLRPFKGDTHLHSGFSGCCHQKEYLSPEYYAAVNCSRGMDFIGIADHKQHFPSLKAMDFIQQCGASFQVYPSEEVHLPDLHTIHNLNFGGDKGISWRLFKGQKEYDAIYKHYLAKVPAYKDHFMRHLAANYHVVHDLVHEAGGVNVFCHPFWRPNSRLFLPPSIRDYVLENRLFDAIEVFGDGKRNADESHAMYMDLCLKAGQYFPAMGNTDAHGMEGIAKNQTVIFAEKNEFSSLKNALLAGRNVAVSFLAGEFPRTTGPLSWVTFYHFLRENYFEKHDMLRRKEADLLFKALATGDVDPQYESFIHRPYKERLDGVEEMKKLVFSPDKEGFAALHKELAELDKEFWG